MYMQEIDMDECDYDGRTALHVAAAEGHLHVVKFLLEIVGVQVKVELVVHSIKHLRPDNLKACIVTLA